MLDFGVISIHAPSRERQSLKIKKGDEIYFNPRSLAGATPYNNDFDTAIFISIHAPSRERLKRYDQIKRLERISIHAPSRERPARYGNGCLSLTFQSTLPRGSDTSGAVGSFAASYFNPRSLAGATDKRVTVLRQPVISIHAPSRERRRFRRILCTCYGNFNPRSLAGATLISIII